MAVQPHGNLVPTWLYQEQVTAKSTDLGFLRSYFQPFVSFVSRPKMLLWLFVVLLYMTGDSVTSITIRPLLVDRGLSLSDIGWILGVVNYSAQIASALIAGVMIMQWGRQHSLIVFGLVAAVTTLLYILSAIGTTQSMAHTALPSATIDNSDRTTAATDYTIQISIMFLGGIAATILSGILAQRTGYTPTFIVSAAVSWLSVCLSTKVYDRENLRY